MTIKPIPGFESQYLIDEYGNIYSQSRTVSTGIDKTGFVRQVGGNILKTYSNKYTKEPYVKLNKNNKRHSFMVQHLMRLTFGDDVKIPWRS